MSFQEVSKLQGWSWIQTKLGVVSHFSNGIVLVRVHETGAVDIGAYAIVKGTLNQGQIESVKPIENLSLKKLFWIERDICFVSIQGKHRCCWCNSTDSQRHLCECTRKN